MTEHFLKTLNDTELQAQLEPYLSLLADFPANPQKYQELTPEQKAEVRGLVEESVRRQLYQLANIQYLIMERTGDYGLLGEQRVSISFCRLLKNIPPDREVTQFDADSFRRQILADRKSIQQFSLAELNHRVDNFSLNILGKSVTLNQTSEINRILLSLGSRKRLFSGTSRHKSNFLYGDAQMKKKENYNILIFATEDMRSPFSPLSVVAGNSKNNINIRRISCETIFYNKWQRVFDYSESEKRRLMENLENNIGETIKLKALSKYQVNDGDKLSGIKKLFVDEIIEGVLWHEIGHGVINKHILEPKYLALWKTFHSLTDDFSTIMGEFLGDWAPPRGDIKGPLAYFLELSQKGEVNRAKAERMLYVYLSDNWFLSHEETAGLLPSQTDLLCAVLLPYFTKDGIDFASFQDAYKQTFERFLREFKISMDKLISPIERAVFNVNGSKYGFTEVNLIIQEILRHPQCKASWEKSGEAGYETFYWGNIIDWTEKYAPETFQQVKALLRDSLADFKRRLLEILTGPETAQKYNHNLRAWMFDRLKELGLYTPVEPISNESVTTKLQADKDKEEASISKLKKQRKSPARQGKKNSSGDRRHTKTKRGKASQ